MKFSARSIRHTFLLSVPLCASILAVSTVMSPVLTARAWSQEPVKPLVEAAAQAPITLDELSKLVGEPTTVTFTGTNVPIKNVTQMLLKAAGLTVSAGTGGIVEEEDPSIKAISVNWQKIPFWEAAQQVEDVTDAFWCGVGSNGLTLQRLGKPGTPLPGNIMTPDIPGLSFVDLMNAGNLNGRVAFESPYLKLLATSISSGRQASNALSITEEEENAPTWDARLKLAVYPDPKLKIASMQVSDVKVVVARGMVIEAPENQVPIFDFGLMGIGGRKGLFSTKNVTLPGLNTDTILSKISGIVHLNIIVGTDNWKEADLLANPTNTHTVNGITFNVGKAHLENGALHMEVTANSARPTHDPLSGLNLSDDSLKIYDGKGRRLQQDMNLNKEASFSGTFQTGIEGAREFNKELVFKGDNDFPIEGPISIEWSLPSDIRPLDVPFELHDVKMP